VGTYRNKPPTELLEAGKEMPLELIRWDATCPADDERLRTAFATQQRRWDLFISCVGQLSPIGHFFDLPFGEWEKSVSLNSLAQLRALHTLFPYRTPEARHDIVFFAGGGTNGPFEHYSAYAAGKLMLIKMIELIANENPDVNIAILGTGWVRTKIHEQTLAAKSAGTNLETTRRFLASNQQGTSFDEIYEMISWVCAQDIAVTSGRNFAVAHDAWKTSNGERLKEWLRGDPDKYRLRRFGNNWEPPRDE
jgi:short-subunit dehydrogenase